MALSLAQPALVYRSLWNDPIEPLAGYILRGLDSKAHLLGNVSTDKGPNGMVLPARRFGDPGRGRAFIAAQEFQNSLRLAALAGPRFLPGFRRCGCYLFRAPLVST